MDYRFRAEGSLGSIEGLRRDYRELWGEYAGIISD